MSIGAGWWPRRDGRLWRRQVVLFRELEQIRRRGHAVYGEEACIELRCIASVVYNDCSELLAAISVSGMTSRNTDERLPVLGCIVRSIAAELTVVLGGAMPPVAVMVP